MHLARRCEKMSGSELNISVIPVHSPTKALFIKLGKV
jgi:hypothetical protein